MRVQESALSEVFDAAIIGGGVVGCAIARRLTLEGWRVVLVEKAHDILDGASKGNSAILHTGFDAPTGSLEARCIADGYAEYRSIHQRLGLPLIEAGALVLAWTEQEEARLDALIDRAHANGVDDVARLDVGQIRQLEPELANDVVAGFRVPGEHLLDPWSTPYAYLLHAVENGAVVLRRCMVRDGEFDGTQWRLETSRGSLRARFVINAAGLYGDRVDKALTGSSDFTIRPRKGQFVVFDKPAARLVKHILLPVPTETTKGIVVCRTAFGNLLVGPTAEEQEDRSTAAVDTETLQGLRRAGERILPALAGEDATAFYAGLRPATDEKDYQIRADRARNYITAGGIRSTGLSAALGLARHIHRLCEAFGGKAEPLADPVWPRVGNISEGAPRGWQSPGNGGVVCHCELVTRREIEEALDGPLGACSLAGLKRRTRVTMGRCQGFYCMAQLAAITAGRFTQPMAGDDDLPIASSSNTLEPAEAADVT